MNKKLADDAGVTVIDGDAAFTGPHTVEVTGGPDRLTLTAPTIIINTGSVPVRPDLPGVDGPRILDSTLVQHVPDHSRRLAVIGGGPIGLEFATMFEQFGTSVTVLDHSQEFLGRFDRDVAEQVRADLEKLGITIVSGVDVTGFSSADDSVTVSYDGAEGGTELEADYVLLATGRRPATDGLGLDAAGIDTTDRGAVRVDEHLRTSVEGVYAAGDVNGGPQFTYVSFDDHRIVLSSAWGDGSRTTEGRIIPSTTFLAPPLSQVGMGEDEARADAESRGRTLEVRKKNIADIPIMPRPKILAEPEGVAKFLVDAEDDRILGCVLYCVDSQELINLVTVAMSNGLPASALGSAIYTHPSSSEVFNALLA
ncbi:dihydrolipoyl dehydrogenase family protein [Dietzia sp.]|uniref:dihydrolipoyl dehydrogenase family protein n=1 Tax=Dietzia sp. TaxID=1871616 RepID=UPI003FA5D3CC